MRIDILICEGPCNPGLRQLDIDIARLRHGDPRGNVIPFDDYRLLTRLRAMRHTPHRHVAGLIWTCEVCNAERRSPG